METKISRAISAFSLKPEARGASYELGYLQGLRFSSVPGSFEEEVISSLINLQLRFVSLEGGFTYNPPPSKSLFFKKGNFYVKYAGNQFTD